MTIHCQCEPGRCAEQDMALPDGITCVLRDHPITPDQERFNAMCDAARKEAEEKRAATIKIAQGS